MISKMFVLGSVLAAILLLASDARSLSNKKSIAATDKLWTAQDLSTMAKTKTMEAAVSFLTSAVQATGAPALQLDEIKEIIDNKPAADVRTALLVATGDTAANRKTKGDKKIADFAYNVDPAAVCATKDTAGGHGIDVCVAGCEDTGYYLSWASRKGACYMLCSLATAPCAEEPFSWRTMATDWGTPVIEWIAKLMSLKTKWITKLSLNTIVILMLLVAVANKAYHEMECSKIRARIHKVQGLQRRCTRAENKAKGAILVETHRNFHAKHLESKALRRWHDFAACATYRASQQAATKAKAVALQAAIDAVAAEQVTTDEGAGACVLS